eukprot:6336571-Pyramimonas_sp.AAC.1
MAVTKAPPGQSTGGVCASSRRPWAATCWICPRYLPSRRTRRRNRPMLRAHQKDGCGETACGE